MSFLTESLPTKLIIDGVEHPIKTDFRAVLVYDEILKRVGDDATQLPLAFLSMLGKIPNDIQGATEQLNWFVQCGEEPKKGKPANKLLGLNNKTPLDYIIDARLIWSAFMRIYRIDLQSIEYLHWWKFQALLHDIGDGTRLASVMEIRTKDLTAKGISKESKRALQAMQKYLEIKPHETEKEKKLKEALRNGEDITPYL